MGSEVALSAVSRGGTTTGQGSGRTEGQPGAAPLLPHTASPRERHRRRLHGPAGARTGTAPAGGAERPRHRESFLQEKAWQRLDTAGRETASAARDGETLYHGRAPARTLLVPRTGNPRPRELPDSVPPSGLPYQYFSSLCLSGSIPSLRFSDAHAPSSARLRFPAAGCPRPSPARPRGPRGR